MDPVVPAGHGRVRSFKPQYPHSHPKAQSNAADSVVDQFSYFHMCVALLYGDNSRTYLALVKTGGFIEFEHSSNDPHQSLVELLHVQVPYFFESIDLVVNTGICPCDLTKLIDLLDSLRDRIVAGRGGGECS